MLKGVVEVKSSFIESVEWEGSTLGVIIKGNKYSYKEVTKEDILSFISHKAPGKFFNESIKSIYPLVNPKQQ